MPFAFGSCPAVFWVCVIRFLFSNSDTSGFQNSGPASVWHLTASCSPAILFDAANTEWTASATYVAVLFGSPLKKK
eukprot:9265784-Prorocentrum_lima.AAC.1